MTTSELIRLLQSEGFANAKAYVIGHGIAAGHLKRPRINGSLCFDWSATDVRAVRRYLANTPKPGRRKAAVA